MLAKKAGVSVETIKRLERRNGALNAQKETLAAIKKTLEREGIEFLDEEQEKFAGPGLRIVNDWKKVFRREMREACDDFLTASFYMHEEDETDFSRRGHEYIMNAVLEDFTNELKRTLRLQTWRAMIKEPRVSQGRKPPRK